MIFLLLGCLGFAPMYLYDRLKIRGQNRSWLFVLGCLCVFAGSAGSFFSGAARFELHAALKVLFGLLALANAVLMVWSLFFSLPKETYGGETSAIVDTGFYALCRHPGVLFFGGMHLFLWPVSGHDTMLLGALLFTLCDVLYVCVQDKKYFPLLMPGYEDYRKRVPFLVPTGGSVDRCIKTL